MKIRKHFSQIAISAGVLLIVSLATAGTCLAGGLVSVHGSSGHIERMGNLTSTDNIYFGWGLDIIQKPGVFNWLHYSIPTTPGTKTRYLLLRYETGANGDFADSIITNLHVFDGETRIYANDSINLSGGPAYTVIDMGEDKTIAWGLGLTIGIKAGVESMSHRMRIYAVWAEYR
jgi:hypothetical protein